MWAGAALGLREERIRRLPRPARAYEQETERYEGLARYVEWRFAPGDRTTVLPNGGFAPTDIRRRCYATGLELALLLDQLRPDWAETLDVNPAETLDALLTPHVARRKSFTAAGREAAMAQAEADVTLLHRERATLREGLLRRPGWRLEIVADPTQPLMPRGFDPMNCTVVRPGEVVHHRYLHLGNATDHLELSGMPALTTAAGTHPLCDGVARLTVPGLLAEPRVSEGGGMLRITGTGLTIETPSASITRERRLIRLCMGKPA